MPVTDPCPVKPEPVGVILAPTNSAVSVLVGQHLLPLAHTSTIQGLSRSIFPPKHE